MPEGWILEMSNYTYVARICRTDMPGEAPGQFPKGTVETSQLHGRLVNSCCPCSPLFVLTIPWPPPVLISLVSTSCSCVTAQWLKLTSLGQVLEKQRHVQHDHAPVELAGQQGWEKTEVVGTGCQVVPTNWKWDRFEERVAHRGSHWGRFLEQMGPRLCLRGRTYRMNVLWSSVVGGF